MPQELTVQKYSFGISTFLRRWIRGVNRVYFFSLVSLMNYQIYYELHQSYNINNHRRKEHCIGELLWWAVRTSNPEDAAMHSGSIPPLVCFLLTFPFPLCCWQIWPTDHFWINIVRYKFIYSFDSGYSTEWIKSKPSPANCST